MTSNSSGYSIDSLLNRTSVGSQLFTGIDSDLSARLLSEAMKNGCWKSPTSKLGMLRVLTTSVKNTLILERGNNNVKIIQEQN